MFRFPGISRGAWKSFQVEGCRDIPFEIKRVFYIFGGNGGIVRGKHANCKSEFVLFNVSGTSKVRIINGDGEAKEYSLDAPDKAVYLPKMVWKEMYGFSGDSVLMVLTNEYYDPGEYIRDFDEYVRLMGGRGDEGIGRIRERHGCNAYSP